MNDAQCTRIRPCCPKNNRQHSSKEFHEAIEQEPKQFFECKQITEPLTWGNRFTICMCVRPASMHASCSLDNCWFKDSQIKQSFFILRQWNKGAYIMIEFKLKDGQCNLLTSLATAGNNFNHLHSSHAYQAYMFFLDRTWGKKNLYVWWNAGQRKAFLSGDGVSILRNYIPLICNPF